MNTQQIRVGAQGADFQRQGKAAIGPDERVQAPRKFLIVSTYAPPAISGAPLMAYNLLRYFPENSFAILTTHVGLDQRAIASGLQLHAKYFFFDTPTLTRAPQNSEGFFARCKRSIKQFRWSRMLFHFISLFYLPFNAVRQGKKIIKEEKVELLLAYSDHGPALLSVYLLHRVTKRPFCLFFYDLYDGNNFPWFFRVLARFLEPKLMRSAERVFAMCEGLAGHYTKKYGREISVIHNSIPIDRDAPPRILGSHPGPSKIAFTGTIYWAQIGAVKNLIEAVEGLPDANLVLYLYTPHEKSFLEAQGLFESERVVFASGSPEEMAAIQKSADILFVGLSFGTRFPTLINTSSPGKTCEYLTSGRAILIHAPKESYIARYARAHGFACVVDKDDIEELRQAILRLTLDKRYANQLVANARRTALLNHDAPHNSAKLQECLSHCM